MAEQERVATDDVKALTPAVADARPLAERVPTDDITALESTIADTVPQTEPVTSNNITALKPAMIGAGSLAELPSGEHTIEPLDQLEDPKVRTKLRIYAILVALYVCYPILAFGEHRMANDTFISSSSS